MKLLLIGIIVFLVIMYIFTYVRYKKMKKNRIRAVDDFKKKYHKEGENLNSQGNSQNRSSDDHLIAYITKYNSMLDYVERDQLVEECQDVKKPKVIPRKLQF